MESAKGFLTLEMASESDLNTPPTNPSLLRFKMLLEAEPAFDFELPSAFELSPDLEFPPFFEPPSFPEVEFTSLLRSPGEVDVLFSSKGPAIQTSECPGLLWWCSS